MHSNTTIESRSLYLQDSTVSEELDLIRIFLDKTLAKQKN